MSLQSNEDTREVKFSLVVHVPHKLPTQTHDQIPQTGGSCQSCRSYESCKSRKLEDPTIPAYPANPTNPTNREILPIPYIQHSSSCKMQQQQSPGRVLAKHQFGIPSFLIASILIVKDNIILSHSSYPCCRFAFTQRE